jgi:hypothetical protein
LGTTKKCILLYVKSVTYLIFQVYEVCGKWVAIHYNFWQKLPAAETLTRFERIATQKEAKMGRYEDLLREALKEQRPESFSRMLKNGELNQFLKIQADQARHEKAGLMRSGAMRDYEAEEILLKDLLIIPYRTKTGLARV